MALVEAGRWTLTKLVDVRLSLPPEMTLPQMTLPDGMALHIGPPARRPGSGCSGRRGSPG